MARRHRLLAAGAAICALGLVVVAFLVSSDRPRENVGPAIRPALGVEEGASASRPPGSFERPLPPRPFVETAPSETRPESREDLQDLILRGRIIDTGGQPVPSSYVSMFPMVSGVPKETWKAIAFGDGEGRFQMEVGSPPRTDCVIVAHKDGWRPATLRIDPTTIDWKREVILELDRGVAIEGVVRLDGERLAGALVTADRAYGTSGLHSWNAELRWADGVFEMKAPGMVETDAQGRFTISGLARATYELRVQRLIHPSFDLDCTLQVLSTAPASDVVLSVESGRLRIRVIGDAGPVAAAALVVVSGRGGGSLRREKCSSFELAVATGVSYTVEAVAPAFDPQSVTVPPLTSREVRDVEIRLRERAPRGLLLRPRVAPPVGLSTVGVRLVPHDKLPESEPTAVQFLRARLSAVRREDGSFLVRDVPYPAGRYTLLVVPDSSSSFLLASRAETSLEDRGMTEVSVDVALGGRGWIEVRDATGRDVWAEVSLRDGSGAIVHTCRMSGDMRMTSGGIGPGGVTNPQDSRQEFDKDVLAPGIYEAEVQSPGFRTVRRTIAIKAGMTTEEEVRLERQ